MNKAELLEVLVQRTKLRPTYVRRIVDAIFSPVDGVIAKNVKKGKRVTIAGFGTFDRRTHKERVVSSALTGTTTKVNARRLPGFRAGVTFKDTVR